MGSSTRKARLLLLVVMATCRPRRAARALAGRMRCAAFIHGGSGRATAQGASTQAELFFCAGAVSLPPVSGNGSRSHVSPFFAARDRADTRAEPHRDRA